MSPPTRDPRSHRELKRWVEAKIGAECFADVFAFVEQAHLTLWCEHQEPPFLQLMLLMILYRDVTGRGYIRVLNQLRVQPSIGISSFMHNERLIHQQLKKWAKRQFVLGNAADWNADASTIRRPRQTHGGNLWIDSSDFRLSRRAGKGVKDAYFSYKANSMARRFMLLRDGAGRVRKLWGGYSPKLYDGHLIELYSDWMEENLDGGVVFGDGHFGIASTLFDDDSKVRFITPVAKKSKKMMKRLVGANGDGADLVIRTNEDSKLNADIAHVRARVEKNFAWVKNTFQTLSIKYQGQPSELDCIVYFAFGVNNYNINH